MRVDVVVAADGLLKPAGRLRGVAHADRQQHDLPLRRRLAVGVEGPDLLGQRHAGRFVRCRSLVLAVAVEAARVIVIRVLAGQLRQRLEPGAIDLDDRAAAREPNPHEDRLAVALAGLELDLRPFLETAQRSLSVLPWASSTCVASVRCSSCSLAPCRSVIVILSRSSFVILPRWMSPGPAPPGRWSRMPMRIRLPSASREEHHHRAGLQLGRLQTLGEVPIVAPDEARLRHNVERCILAADGQRDGVVGGVDLLDRGALRPLLAHSTAVNASADKTVQRMTRGMG